MNAAQKRRLLRALFLLLVLALTGLGAYRIPTTQQYIREIGTYSVLEFDDGDTIVVDMNGVPEKVRFIGVDTPETKDPRKAVQCYGAEASEFTKQRIGSHPVRLESDPTNTNRDRYNRLLRYVYLPDGTLMNAELIRQGYGFAYTSFPFEKKSDFVLYQDQAVKTRAGLWGACQPALNEYGGYTSNDVPAT